MYELDFYIVSGIFNSFPGLVSNTFGHGIVNLETPSYNVAWGDIPLQPGIRQPLGPPNPPTAQIPTPVQNPPTVPNPLPVQNPLPAQNPLPVQNSAAAQNPAAATP